MRTSRFHTAIIIAVLALRANYPVTLVALRIDKWVYRGQIPTTARWDLSSQGSVVGHLYRGFGQTFASMGDRQVAYTTTMTQSGAFPPSVGTMRTPPWPKLPSLPGFQVAHTERYGWPWRWAEVVEQFNYNVRPVARQRSLGLVPLGLLANTAFFAACLSVGVMVFRGTIERVRIARGCCRRCGYELAGLTRCPECGTGERAHSVRPFSLGRILGR
jgi:hypothetical protein